MKETTLKQLCHRHFNETCDRLASIRGLRHRDERSIVNMALNQEAPFFYVSPRYAAQRIYELNRNYAGTLARMRPQARSMWTDLHRLVMREVHRSGLTCSDAVNKVLRERRAPRFYMELDTALLIRRRQRALKRRSRL